ncbi:hypothetical protein [Methanolobus halotolerans]|uniref:Uncharacterized protein n=1 Tax=Methanolobus halotolerans TaxID=2052935 RepID=A0A4E0Q614_9EURY|nr:hypothetical protein [Methanolobus halotolerans]TGC09426.1 hypothetical protein CUN85_06245 [Methanolobus halotolerans]
MTENKTVKSIFLRNEIIRAINKERVNQPFSSFVCNLLEDWYAKRNTSRDITENSQDFIVSRLENAGRNTRLK